MNNKEDPLALERSLYLVKQTPVPLQEKKQKTKETNTCMENRPEARSAVSSAKACD